MDLEPGWRPDPSRHHLERWWDGQQWTDRVRDGGEDESTSDFNLAMATPVESGGGLPLWRRTSVRVLAATVLVASLAWLLTGPLPDLLDGLPPSASAGTPDDEGLGTAAHDLARAATNGRWSVAAAYWPEATRDERRAIADALRDCLGDDVIGADLAPAEASVEVTGPGTVLVRATPRVEQLVDLLTLRLAMEHHEGRWVVVAPLERALDDQPLITCPALPAARPQALTGPS